jgi:hypothetical protein
LFFTSVNRFEKLVQKKTKLFIIFEIII